MTKSELEKKLFLHLTKVEFSTFDDMIKLFQCTKQNLTDIIENNTKTKSEPLGFILADKQKPHITILLNRQIMKLFIFKLIII